MELIGRLMAIDEGFEHGDEAKLQGRGVTKNTVLETEGGACRVSACFPPA